MKPAKDRAAAAGKQTAQNRERIENELRNAGEPARFVLVWYSGRSVPAQRPFFSLIPVLLESDF
ncbi:MAG: hypothetical protein ABFC31_06395 [Clostridiaceae bacterium]